MSVVNIACVDLDGVLYVYKKHSGVLDFSRPPNPEALKLVRRLKEEGWMITIYSSRLNGTWKEALYEEIRAKVIEWLEKYDVVQDPEGELLEPINIHSRWYPTR